jgi:antitoxin HicB
MTIYPARITGPFPDFVITFRDVPEAATGAMTAVQAWRLAPDALACALEAYRERRARLPVRSERLPGERVVTARFSAT